MAPALSRVCAFSIAGGCAGILVAGLGYALINGSWYPNASELLDNPWGVATLVEVYIGFVFVGAWIVCRERHFGRASLWVALLFLLGNLVAALYILLALHRCGGDMTRFWLGFSLKTLDSPLRK